MQIIRDVDPKAKIWVWSDMFDPNHNAVDNYYLVNGTWAGSWEGLDPDVGIVNWANRLKGKNLKWFADRGQEQVLAGYYDHREWVIAEWLAAGKGLPGITGAMYTTWTDDYSDMEAWAKAACFARCSWSRSTTFSTCGRCGSCVNVRWSPARIPAAPGGCWPGTPTSRSTAAPAG